MHENSFDLIEARLAQLKRQIEFPQKQTQNVADQLSREAIEKIIDERIKAYTAPVGAIDNKLQQFDGLFEKALKPDELQEFKKYVQNGSPGFDSLVSGDKLYPVIQLLWEVLKDGQNVR